MPRRFAAILLLVLLAACGKDEKTPTGNDDDPPPQTGFAFTYVPPAGAPSISSITVPGSFNNWSTTALRMSKQPDGSWVARTPLADGRYQYKFYINGAWPPDMCDNATWGDPVRDNWIDPDAVGCVDDGNGGRNAVMDVGSGPTDLAFSHSAVSPAHLSAAGGRLSVRFRANAGMVQSATLRAGDQSYPMHLQLTVGLQEVWRGTLPEGAASYSISLQTAAGVREEGPFNVPANPFRAVPWVGGAVGYQIFPERFWNGDRTNDRFGPETDAYGFMHPSFRGTPPSLASSWSAPMNSEGCCHQYYGGDLQGIVDRLSHLQGLGVTLIYMNPIWSSGSAHGYDTFDYMRVEPSFGDTTVLRTLLTEARSRGIRVMWDFVPNHTGVGHWAFQDAVQRGTASPQWPWFNFRVANTQVQVGNAAHYDAWFGFGSLPKLNTSNTGVMTHLMDVVTRWTQFGFDGIRVDVPNELSNATQFFRTMRQTAKGINPESYLVGEIWQRNPAWLQGDQFDALMNYAIGRDVVLRFVKGEMSAGTASQAMAQLYADYPEASAAMQFNLVSSHDTERLLTGVGGGELGGTPGAEALARQRLASAMLYALPGVPVTFQGDECAQLGSAGDATGRNRFPVQWDLCSSAMLAHYTRLGTLKRGVGALGTPAIRLHRAQGTLLSFFRGEPGAGELLAVFNGGAAARALTLPEGSWADLVSGQQFTGTATVDAFGWRYLQRR